jgi:hypothetical protein
MMEDETEPQPASNNASSTTDVDVENPELVAYKGEAVTEEVCDTTLDETFDKEDTNKGTSYSQSCFKKNKVAMLCMAGVVVVVAVVLSSMAAREGGITGNGKRGDDSSSVLLGIAEMTSSPTISPSGSPTSSPTVIPQWDINYIGMEVDFAMDAAHELEVQYEIGIDRLYNSELYAVDCASPIVGIAPRLTAERLPNDDYSERLNLRYKFDKGRIRDSNIWNGLMNRMELCQVVQLLLATGDGDAFVISQDKRTLNVGIDLLASFNTGNVGVEVQLAAAGDDENVETVSVGARVDASEAGLEP